MDKKAFEHKSPARLFAITIALIFTVEAIIMMALYLLPPLSEPIGIFLDSFFLIVFLFPALYLFLFRPLVFEINQCENAQKEAEDLAKFPSENPLPVLRVSEDGSILYSNRACAQFMRSLKCEIGQPVPENMRKLVSEAISFNERKEYEIKENGVTFLFFIMPLVKSGYVNIYGFDITSREEAMKNLKEAMEIKSKFTSMASHELKNPMAAVKEGVNLVLDDVVGDVNLRQKNILTMVRNNINRIIRITSDILDVQKMESGRMQFKPRMHDINESVKTVYQSMNVLTEGKGLYFDLKLAKGLPKISYDEDKIIEVLTNLLTNAIKFTEKGGITIETSQDDNVIRVMVKDTGHGVKKEDIPRLFSAFEQLEAAKANEEKGTGLGLVICKEIIAGHRGRIWAESELGKGTSFYFDLPVKERRLAF